MKLITILLVSIAIFGIALSTKVRNIDMNDNPADNSEEEKRSKYCATVTASLIFEHDFTKRAHLLEEQKKCVAFRTAKIEKLKNKIKKSVKSAKRKKNKFVSKSHDGKPGKHGRHGKKASKLPNIIKKAIHYAQKAIKGAKGKKVHKKSHNKSHKKVHKKSHKKAHKKSHKKVHKKSHKKAHKKAHKAISHKKVNKVLHKALNAVHTHKAHKVLHKAHKSHRSHKPHNSHRVKAHKSHRPHNTHRVKAHKVHQVHKLKKLLQKLNAVLRKHGSVPKKVKKVLVKKLKAAKKGHKVPKAVLKKLVKKVSKKITKAKLHLKLKLHRLRQLAIHHNNSHQHKKHKHKHVPHSRRSLKLRKLHPSLRKHRAILKHKALKHKALHRALKHKAILKHKALRKAIQHHLKKVIRRKTHHLSVVVRLARARVIRLGHALSKLAHNKHFKFLKIHFRVAKAKLGHAKLVRKLKILHIKKRVLKIKARRHSIAHRFSFLNRNIISTRKGLFIIRLRLHRLRVLRDRLLKTSEGKKLLIKFRRMKRVWLLRRKHVMRKVSLRRKKWLGRKRHMVKKMKLMGIKLLRLRRIQKQKSQRHKRISHVHPRIRRRIILVIRRFTRRWKHNLRRITGLTIVQKYLLLIKRLRVLRFRLAKKWLRKSRGGRKVMKHLKKFRLVLALKHLKKSRRMTSIVNLIENKIKQLTKKYKNRIFTIRKKRPVFRKLLKLRAYVFRHHFGKRFKQNIKKHLKVVVKHGRKVLVSKKTGKRISLRDLKRYLSKFNLRAKKVSKMIGHKLHFIKFPCSHFNKIAKKLKHNKKVVNSIVFKALHKQCKRLRIYAKKHGKKY